MGAGERRWSTPARVVGLQVVVALAVAAVALAWSVAQARSALIGGIVAILPNAYFAWATNRAGRRAGGEGEAVAAAGKLLGQWLVKIALTVALLIAALVLAGAGGIGFFAGLGAALLAPLAAPLLGGDRNE